MDIIVKIPVYFWSFAGLIVFWVFKLTASPLKKVSTPESEKARKFTVQYLSMVLTFGGIFLAVYSIYIFYKDGGAAMTPEELNQIASRLDVWLYIYEAVLYAFMGIAICGLAWFVYSLIKRKPDDNQDRITTISTSELNSIKNKVNEIKQAKKDVDSFLNDIKDDQ